MAKTLCVAEYSVSQNAFNIDMLDKILKLNNYMSLKGFSNDYKIICIGSYQKCKEKMEQMKKELEEQKNEK
jgi:hypothetical protein